MNRIILHVDVNNAFLSWTATEVLKKASKVDIRTRYAIIGGNEKERKGIVLAKSNPCKLRGVVTAEPIYSARKKCPYLEVYPPDFKLYKSYSDQMYKYLSKYTDIIERYSIDECFLDYTGSCNLFGDPIKLAYKIKNDIYKMFGFTVNVGVGNNKLLAKMASDFEKPNKVHTLFSDEIESKMFSLPVENLFMIGRASSKRLHEMNIHTIGDLAHTDINLLLNRFKSTGKIMHDYANGIDNSPVYYEKETVKSISSSTVLSYNYHDVVKIKRVILELAMDVSRKLRDNKMFANVVGVWIKYDYFSKVSKQEKLDNCVSTDEEIFDNALRIFNKIWNKEDGIRSICVFIGDLSSKRQRQLSLFDDNLQDSSADKLQAVIDEIRDKYGKNSINFANIRSDFK